MEHKFRIKKPLHLSEIVKYRLNISQQLLDASSENKKYMKTSIDQLSSMSLELSVASQKIQEHIINWSYYRDYKYWISYIKPDYTVDIRDNPSVKKWVVKYSNLQKEFDKLRYKIAIKKNSINKSYEIQKKLIEPVRNNTMEGEPEGLNLDQINGTITPTQFEIIKEQMMSISRNSVNSAILLSMSSDDIIRIFLSPTLTLPSFIEQVRKCVYDKNPFGNIASNTSINDPETVNGCILEIKAKHNIYTTTIATIMSENQTININEFDKLIIEFTKIITAIENDFGTTNLDELFGEKDMFGKESITSKTKMGIISNEVSKERNNILEKNRESVFEANKRAEETTPIPTSTPTNKEKPIRHKHKHAFYEFSPDESGDIDNEILTGIIILISNYVLAFENMYSLSDAAKTRLYSVFIYTRSILDGFCDRVGSSLNNIKTVCSAHINSAKEIVSNVLSEMFSALSTPLQTPPTQTIPIMQGRPIKKAIIEKNPNAQRRFSLPTRVDNSSAPGGGGGGGGAAAENTTYTVPEEDPEETRKIEEIKKIIKQKIIDREKERREKKRLQDIIDLDRKEMEKEINREYGGKNKTYRNKKFKKLMSHRKNYSRRK